jgi:hypothetical protein
MSKKKPGKLCEDCQDPKTTYHRTLEKYLCEECSESDDNTLICKSTAKQKYFLTEKDLEDIEYYEVDNPHWRCASSMKLYTRADILEKFYDKYNANSDNEEQKRKDLEKNRKKRSIVRLNTKELKRKKRKQKLTEALKEYKLKIRADSSLCEQYINGTLKGWNLDKIVKRLCQMHYLFNYCNIQKYINIVKEDRQQEKRWNGYYDGSVSVVDEAEELILKKIKKYPTVWPWMVADKIKEI